MFVFCEALKGRSYVCVVESHIRTCMCVALPIVIFFSLVSVCVAPEVGGGLAADVVIEEGGMAG